MMIRTDQNPFDGFPAYSAATLLCSSILAAA